MISTEHIKALGSLLNFYESDLEYIARFQEIKAGGYTEEYLNGEKAGSFKAFINEFRVARNISGDNVDNTRILLDETVFWVNGKNTNDVDRFAMQIRNTGITPLERTPVSLASKILMLNNPWEILPMDSLTRRTLKYNKPDYTGFKIKLNKYIENNSTDLLEQLSEINQLLIIVEDKFKGRLDNIEAIRFNRYVDKVLWVG